MMADRSISVIQKFRGKNRIVEVDGQLWHLPANRSISDIPLEYPMGDALQDATTAAAAKWEPSQLSIAERDAIARRLETEGEFAARRLQKKYRGTHIQKMVMPSFPDLEWYGKGVDAIDPTTGLAYEIMSGTKRKMGKHAKRMPTVFFRIIGFK